MQWPTWFGGPDYQRAARPYFAPDEGKGLIQWPYDPRAAPSIAVLGGILGVGMIAFALLFEPWPVPSWNLVFAGIVATVVTLGFSFASRQPAALAFDRKGLVAGRARPVAWRDVENLTLGIGIAPYGRLKSEDARAAFAEQIAALAEGGVDLIILETFSDVHEVVEALNAAREVAPHLPIVTQMTFTADDRTMMGYLPGRVARELSEAGADVIGVNCSGGPAQIARVLMAMEGTTPQGRFSAMPNAGLPESVGGRMMYPATTSYFAEYALTFKALGASIIGGCCGTTPEHIAAMRAALDDPSRPIPHIPIFENSDDEEELFTPTHSELADKLKRSKFVVSVEMAPPRSHSLTRMIQSAEMLREAGADVINVPDSPTARMRRPRRVRARKR